MFGSGRPRASSCTRVRTVSLLNPRPTDLGKRAPGMSTAGSIPTSKSVGDLATMVGSSTPRCTNRLVGRAPERDTAGPTPFREPFRISKAPVAVDGREEVNNSTQESAWSPEGSAVRERDVASLSNQRPRCCEEGAEVDDLGHIFVGDCSLVAVSLQGARDGCGL